jgi:hypothetical protein
VSHFRQKATALASTAFFNKRSPAIAHAFDERNGELTPSSRETAKPESACRPLLLAKPRKLFAVSVNAPEPPSLLSDLTTEAQVVAALKTSVRTTPNEPNALPFAVVADVLLLPNMEAARIRRPSRAATERIAAAYASAAAGLRKNRGPPRA